MATGEAVTISYNFREAYLEITVDLLVSVLDSLSLPEAKFLTGWSHGKEALKDGSYDTYKGSFYVNCGEFGHASVNSQNSDVAYSAYPEVTASNVWPPEEMLPGFRQCFEELCNLIIDIAASVARACDRYALAKIPGYESGYLEKVIRTSSTTKARLLHYFPPHADDHVKQSVLEGEPRESSEELLDSWCATHIDHGCLTGLTSAVYIDESSHEPRLSSSQGSPLPLPHLPFLPNAPDPRSGLYIRSRLGDITRILIPSDCLAFQTGESLQLITGGKFRAVPHFVQAGKALGDTARVARNTLAVFTQPGLDEVVDRETGKTFAQFSMEVAERFG
ncbi:MAG: hypothetical protein L6R37_003007 [Teloschistes peruensis]|nr:MAG: hypothetical protein L6R37_003007 [Teloschistes peruensis]